jgi:hypothetical protein
MKDSPGAFAIAVVLAHAAVVAVHGAAHRELAIALTVPQRAFVAAFVLIFPLGFGALLVTSLRRVAGAALAACFAADFLFGVYNHFFAGGHDNVLEVAGGGWGAAFRWTSVLLGVTEALGCWAGVRVWTTRAAAPPALR